MIGVILSIGIGKGLGQISKLIPIWMNWNSKFCGLPKYLPVIWKDKPGMVTLLLKKYCCNLISKPWDLSSAIWKILSLSSWGSLRIFVSKRQDFYLTFLTFVFYQWGKRLSAQWGHLKNRALVRILRILRGTYKRGKFIAIYWIIKLAKIIC